jgi:uncharacterized protein YjbI with pentapeptide repeats
MKNLFRTIKNTNYTNLEFVQNDFSNLTIRFENCMFESCKFNRLDFQNYEFVNCTFIDCVCINSNLSNSKFDSCIVYIEFDKSNLSNVTFTNCNYDSFEYDKRFNDFSNVVVKDSNYNVQGSSLEQKLNYSMY